MRRSLDTRNLARAIMSKDDLVAGKPDPDDPTRGGIHLVDVALSGEVTIDAAAKEFLAAKARKSTATFDLYERAVTHFRRFVQAHDLVFLKQISVRHIRAYFAEYADQWLSTTAQSRLTHLRVWFNYCCRPSLRWLQYSPAAEPDLIQSGGTSVERKPFTPEEITKILEAIEETPSDMRDGTRALILLLLYSGMRISDATFFERAALTERHTADYYVIKTRKRIDLPPEIQQAAIDALGKLPFSRVYFFQPDRDDDYREARQALIRGQEFGKFMPDYQRRVRETMKLVRRAVALAGLDGGCHRFRDTFAVNMLVQGANIYTVSKMLGHSDVRITDEHYVKFVPGYRERMSQSTRVLNYMFPPVRAR